MKQLYYFLTKEFKAKTIAYITFFIIFLFGLFHTFAWLLFTEEILYPKKGMVGDLVRISCETKSGNERNVSYTLEKQHTQSEAWDGSTSDILTIGDSFSNGGGGGENRFYQDYIETLHDKRVLNIPPNSMKINKMEMIVALYNNGLLDQIKPKIIILESVERFIIQKFSVPLNWEYKRSKKIMLKDMQHNMYNPKPAAIQKKQNKISVINKRNYDCLLNPIYYSFSQQHTDRNNLVHKADLKKDMFSVEASKTLLFLKETTFNIQFETPENINNLNNNLNKLAALLKNKNITLMFMPIPDKYNLYQSYIQDNPFPKNTFFETLRPLKKDYVFIDTKEILLPYLENTKDVYHADDTHWSSVASEALISNINFNKYF